MSDGIPATTPAQFTRAIIDEVLWWHNQLGNPVTFGDLMAPNRMAGVVQARADCMHRLRVARGWSYPRIGAYFKMDHSSVMHHVRKPIVVKAKAHSYTSACRATAWRRANKKQRMSLIGRGVDPPMVNGGLTTEGEKLEQHL